jgi:hypothetical protein
MIQPTIFAIINLNFSKKCNNLKIYTILYRHSCCFGDLRYSVYLRNQEMSGESSFCRGQHFFDVPKYKNK